jgi:hypothetical protein
MRVRQRRCMIVWVVGIVRMNVGKRGLQGESGQQCRSESRVWAPNHHHQSNLGWGGRKNASNFRLASKAGAAQAACVR